MAPTHPTRRLQDQLRQRAEAMAMKNAAASPDPLDDVSHLSVEALHQIIHELRVHQIELELQNDELRRTQAAFDTAQARYFDFYDLAPVGYIGMDADDQILQANLTTAQLLGLTRGALIGQKLSRFICPQAQDTYYLQRKPLFAAEKPLSFEFRLNQSVGSPLWLHLEAILAHDASGSKVMRGVLSDVTARRQTEDSLKESEQKLSLILDNVDAFIYLKDIQGRYLFANRSVRDLFGVPMDEILGRDDSQFFDAETVAQLQHNEHLVYQTGQTSRKEDHNFRLCNGQTLTFLSIKMPVRNATGAIVGLCGISTDITERKQLEAAQLALAVETGLAASRQQLRDLVALNEATREEERKHIAREIHDELGQVLTALRMDLSLLAMRYGTLDAALHSEVQGMKTLVDSAILEVRNVAAHLRPTALDLGLVAAIEWLCQDFDRINLLPCKLDAQGDLAVDDERAVVIFRIAQESLTNITRYARASRVAVSLGRHGHDLRLEVRDNGCGFDVQAAGQSRSFGLLGMRERARALGGVLDIVSTPGRGTAVTLTIPYVTDLAGGQP
jgi:PAS domain S-box-containing protein